MILKVYIHRRLLLAIIMGHFNLLSQFNITMSLFKKVCSNPEAKITLLGGILIKLGTSIVSTWGNINLYFLSKFREEGYSITVSTNSIILVLTVFPMILCMLASPYLSKKFGYQFITKVCGVIYIITPQLINIKYDMYIFIFSSIIIPASMLGMSIVPIMNCIWTQFPDSKNKMTAIIVFFYGAGSMLWNIIFLHQINPLNREATIKDGDLYFFDKDVTKNVYSTGKYAFLFSGMLFVIGSCLLRRKQTSEESPNEKGQSQQKLNGDSQKKSQALKDIRFILTFLICLLIGFFEVFLVLNVKLIYQSTIQDDHFLSYATIVSSIVGIFGAFVWGYLGDSKGFGSTVLFIVIIDLFIKIYSDFAQTKPFVMIMFVLIGVTSRSLSTTAGPGLVEIFGLQTGTQLLPFKGIALLSGFLLVPIGQIATENWLSAREYLICLSFLNIPVLIMGILLYIRLKKSEKEFHEEQL